MLTLTENMATRDKMRDVQSKLKSLRLNRAEVRGERGWGEGGWGGEIEGVEGGEKWEGEEEVLTPFHTCCSINCQRSL